MNQLRFGAAEYISSRPLLHGLLQSGSASHVSLEPPAAVVESFARGRYDAALVPSIEYLRGAGKYLLAGPALVGRAGPGGILLVSQKPIDAVERIAVGEFCRTPVAVLRIVLAEQHRIYPDLLVEKRIDEDDWRDRYDAALITGDAALRETMAEKMKGLIRYNVAEMWKTLTKAPLVHSVWVYDEKARGDEISKRLSDSRDFGVGRLSEISEEVARTLNIDPMAIYDYFSRTWSYHLGERELDGLRALNDFARKYDLIRESRMAAGVRV